MRWGIVALLCAPLAVVSAWLLATDRTFESTGVVALDPIWVPGLHPTAPIDASPAEAMAHEAALAEGEFGLVLDDAIDFPFSYEVHTDTDAATVTFVMHAGSPMEAWGSALSATAGYAGLHNDPGRVDQSIAMVQSEIERVQAELGAPEVQADAARVEALNVELADLQRRLAAYQVDRETVAGGTAVVPTPPIRPDEPVSPDFTKLVGIALAIGVALAGAALVVTERASPRADHPRRTAKELVLGVIAGVAAPCLLVAVGLSGLHSLWELGRVRDDQVERQLDCARTWMASLPTDSVIHPQPEGRDITWVAALGEAAFPRLEVVLDPAQADLLPQVVPVGDPRQGVLDCAGYKLVVTTP